MDPLGEPRVVFLGYREGESPATLPPAVVLVRPNEVPATARYSGKFRENLGVLTLATCLEEHGARFGVLDASLFQCSPELTASLATAPLPRLIGISAYCTWILPACLELAALVKQRQPETTVVLGGHGASVVARDILERHPEVDGVVSGPGGDSLVRLLRTASRHEWAEIPNLAYRRGGEVVVNAMAAYRDLDERPLPHRVVRDLMARDPVLSRAPMMTVASQGCYGHCSYCSANQFSSGWQGRSPKHVVDELESLLARYSWNTLHFWDDQFIGPGPAGKRRVLAIADEICRRGLKLFFHVTLRASDVTADVLPALVSAGLRSVFIGVETSEQALLDGFFAKNLQTRQSRRALELLWQHGVHRILVGFMLFHPQMSWKTLRADLDLLDSFPNVEHRRLSSRTVYYPGARIWEDVRHLLGPDAYKAISLHRLPSDAFERLYRISANFDRQTMDIDMLFTCLEERHLGDLAIIDFLAGCRTRLFRFMSARIRAVAEHLERGRDCRDTVTRLGDEIFHETLAILADMEQRLGDDYFRLLLATNRLLGYRRLLEANPVHRAPAGEAPPAARNDDAGSTLPWIGAT